MKVLLTPLLLLVVAIQVLAQQEFGFKYKISPDEKAPLYRQTKGKSERIHIRAGAKFVGTIKINKSQDTFSISPWYGNSYILV